MKYLCLFFSLVAATVAHAQLTVTLSIKEHFHLLHEPVLATVNVTNLLGRDITLSDTSQYQWFGFRVAGDNDQVITPRDPNYRLAPLTVKAGGTARRTVNLIQLYGIDTPGTYRVQANIYYDGLDKFFASKSLFIDVSEGRVLWHHMVGVPEGVPGAGQMRTFTLLTHQRGEANTLYVRVEDEDGGTVYCTYPIGRMLDNTEPQIQFDAANNLFVLHLVGMRAYLLTKISPNGEFVGQSAYTSTKSKPTLRRTSDGALQIVGGKRDVIQNPSDAPVPKLSDRPPGFPAN